MDDRVEAPETFPKKNLQKVIWIICLVVLVQIGWTGWRLYRLRIREKENLRLQEEKKAEQRKQVEEELESIPEPVIEEKLAKGGKLWLEKMTLEGDETAESGVLELGIWAVSNKPLSRIDLRIFYPKELLNIVNQEDQGIYQWNSDEGWEAGGFLVTTISFAVIDSGEALIELDFSKESMLDCNLLTADGEDVLEEAQGGTYKIK